MRHGTFARNLRTLIDRDHGGNVSEAARDLGINRTQLAKYLAGVSWPQETPLLLICHHFNTTGSILTHGLEETTDDH